MASHRYEKFNEYPCDRDPITDCLALVAMPGLEELAGGLSPKLDEREGLDFVLVLLIAAAWGSLNTARSVLKNTSLWADMRSSAGSVGRAVPLRAPSVDSFIKMRRRLELADVEAFSVVATGVAARLAPKVGLFVPGVDPDPRSPDPTATALIDGTVFERRTADGGSPGKPDPDDCCGDEGVQSKHNRKVDYGEPFVLATVRGPAPQQRLYLGVQMYLDGNEMGASMRLIDIIRSVAGDGFHAVACDALMTDTHFESLMRDGLVPIARMTAASPRDRFFVEEPEPVLPNRKRTRRKQHEEKKAKRLLRTRNLGTHTHTTADGAGCVHHLWAVDGSLVVREDNSAPTHTDRRLAPVAAWWGLPTESGTRLLSAYEFDCGGCSQRVTFDLSEGGLIRYLRPLPESAVGFNRFFGLREDIESAVSTIKYRLRDFGRSNAEKPEDLWLNLIGHQTVMTAVCWDVHFAHHTPAAKAHEERRIARKVEVERNAARRAADS